MDLKIDDLKQLHLRIDEHSFRDQDMVIVMTTYIKLLRHQDHQRLHEKVQYEDKDIGASLLWSKKHRGLYKKDDAGVLATEMFPRYLK